LRAAGKDPDQVLRIAIGVALLAVAVVLTARTLFPDTPSPAPSGLITRRRNLSTVFWGAFVGFMVGLTSVGSGSLILPFLFLLFPGAPALAVGTDLFHAALLVSATALFHAGVGHVNWPMVATLLCGSLPGVFLGSFLAPRLPVRPMRFGLSLVLFLTGLKLVR
jgi:hypothetical protein